jgi:aspartate kinase
LFKGNNTVTRLLVQKFGGSSLADTDKIQGVASIISTAYDSGTQVVAIVSAMGKTTDGLVALANALHDAPQGREYDMLLATGEMVSASLLALHLQSRGYKAIALTGFQAGIQTEDVYNTARIKDIQTDYVKQLLEAGTIVIVTGFQGENSKGEFCTLGRGGSDTSAVALAGALHADACDIYTDVTGVYSTDPRLVPTAMKLEEIAHIEMLELARLGAKVLHPRSVEAARRWGVKVRVRSTFNLNDEGTLVVDEALMSQDSTRAVAGVACDKNQARVAVTGLPDKPGIAAQLFKTLAEKGISVDMIIQSIGQDGVTNDIAFTVNTWDLQNADAVLKPILKDLGAKDVLLDDQVAKVSIVGVGMIDRPGVAAAMFQALAEAEINIGMIATSEIKISVLVSSAQSEQAVQAIHHAFFSEASTEELVPSKLGY